MYYEEIIPSLEKKAPNALEMAAKANEEGKEKAKAASGSINFLVAFSLYYHQNLYKELSEFLVYHQHRAPVKQSGNSDPRETEEAYQQLVGMSVSA